MATQKQKDEVLTETKQVNAMKLKRNNAKTASLKKAWRALIAVAESELSKKRKAYGI